MGVALSMISNFLLAAVLACDPALKALFTPRHPQIGRFEVCTTVQPLADSLLEGFLWAPIEQLEPLDAFGTSGEYERARLAQLYGGRRVAVLRGWRTTDAGIESATLLSPYPDASLARLQAGTMLIRWFASASQR